MKKKLIIMLFAFFTVFSNTQAIKCIPPINKPVNGIENFSRSDVKTIFMGKVVSKNIKRQSSGYKFFEVTFKVRRKEDVKKGEFPEDGKIKVFVPVSEDLCGYYDKNYFSVGSFMVVYVKKNNGFYVTDKFGLNRKFNDEIKARTFLDNLDRKNESNIVVKVVSNKGGDFEKFLTYLMIFGLLALVVFYILAKKFYWNKNDEDGYREDDKMIYFTTKDDDIEIRVRKDK